MFIHQYAKCLSRSMYRIARYLSWNLDHGHMIINESPPLRKEWLYNKADWNGLWNHQQLHGAVSLKNSQRPHAWMPKKQYVMPCTNAYLRKQPAHLLICQNNRMKAATRLWRIRETVAHGDDGNLFRLGSSPQ